MVLDCRGLIQGWQEQGESNPPRHPGGVTLKLALPALAAKLSKLAKKKQRSKIEKLAEEIKRADLPAWKREQREAQFRPRVGRVLPPEAMIPGNRLKFHGGPATYHVAPNGSIVRDRRKLSKAERKAAKRMRVADRRERESREENYN